MSSIPQTTPENRPRIESGKPKLSYEERRRDTRQVALMKGELKVLDGSNVGKEMEISTRNLSMWGLCFLAKEELRVGQTCEIRLEGRGGKVFEVVRSRLLSSGKWEIAVQAR